ncbi:helix-turn-helix domain-containing protein [Nocardioides sp.]|uniref:winged helix-turn-helix domain-containing protein n=1 Tax=Nocardioides sp. TaxID=35761 RepID=UPI0031FE974F|nr:ArsR family transcriptional regulator [Nocardioides sp.]
MAELRRVHDPKLLRAIAHPLRNRILTELEASGSLRAADIARVLDVPANQASFHLRQLAKYGLVEEDVAAARDKRDRVWRTTSAAAMDVDLGTIEKAPGGKAASAVFRRNKAAWNHYIVDQAYSEDRPEGTMRGIGEFALKLTRDEARQVSDEVSDLLQGWADRTRGTDPDRRTYLLLSIIQPHPDAPPQED